MTFLFTQEDVARQDETAAALLDWDIKKLWRGPEFYYLFGSSEGYTLLPLRAFRMRRHGCALSLWRKRQIRI